MSPFSRKEVYGGETKGVKATMDESNILSFCTYGIDLVGFATVVFMAAFNQATIMRLRNEASGKITPFFTNPQYIHQVMAVFSKTGKEVVMVVDRSGIHRAHKLDATLDHYHGTFRFHFLPAHCGHHLNPIEGFWRVMKDTIGAGRCFGNLQQLYQRTRRVLMVHQERPIYEFHW